MPCPRVPTQIVAFCVMVSLLLLQRLPRNLQGLSHRLANRHKGVLLRGGGAEHPVVGHGDDVYIETYVTGYNTVAIQTDGTPCIGAAGTYICGRNDVVACPPLLTLGTAVEIGGKRYVCEDRTSRKYRGCF